MLLTRLLPFISHRPATLAYTRTLLIHFQRFTHTTAATSTIFPNATQLNAQFTAASAHVQRYGYAVVDNVFTSEQCHAFRSEICNLHAHQLMIPNHTHLVTTQSNTPVTSYLAKRGIHEQELELEGISDIVPALAQLNADRTILTALNTHIPSLHLSSQRIKVQYNEGNGAGFPIHVDNDARLDGRRITCLLYLNPEYPTAADNSNASNTRETHGGELRLYPFPYHHIDITPTFNRLVLFTSHTMLHRVLPSRVPRLCFTIWMSSTMPATTMTATAPTTDLLRSIPEWSQLSSAQLSALSALLHPQVRLHTAKYFLHHEWLQSLEQSHDSEDPMLQSYLRRHQAEVQQIGQILNKHLSQLPPDVLPLKVSQQQQHHQSLIQWL